MASLEPFLLKIKPAMDTFLRQATKQSLRNLENELVQFNWTHMSIFNIQILVPLVLKLDELSDDSQEIRAGCLQCITLVTSKVYLKELSALRTMLVVVLKQIRECDKAATRPNLSEEIKLAAVHCLAECLRRSTSDVLEQFYNKDSAMILGQILMTVIEFIEKDKYKKLVIASLECLLLVFYVHDEADRMDLVLRHQVANTIFIFLPKIVTILYQTALADDKVGETIKIYSIKALGRILCVIYEETSEELIHAKYDVGAFKKLLSESLMYSSSCNDNDFLAIRKNSEQLEQRMKQMQGDGRTRQWIQASSKKLRIIFTKISILRSHTSSKIRTEYALMCSQLLQNCSHNLKENFVFMLETLVALTEDDDIHIRNLCCKCINHLQHNHSNEGIFDENSEILLEEHLTKLPRIIARCDDAEQYSEFTFLKGFLRSLSPIKLQLLLTTPHNLEMFCMCLISALDLKMSQNLLIEEYSAREVNVDYDYLESSKLPWRVFNNISSERCIKCLQEICYILGNTPILNHVVVDYLSELLLQQSEAMNEILLIVLWITTAKEMNNLFKWKDLNLVKRLLDELLNDKHWYLALEPDNATRLKVNKNTDWFVDRTPGLYESAVEIRTQDYDSDDETENSMPEQKVTIADAEFNVLHTCIVLDCLGHCAMYVGERFDGYVFQTLHKVLLKMAHSNSMIYNAANFALVSIQKSLRFNKATQLIEGHTDYITYHLNTLLKKSTESKSAVDILSVVLQFSSRNTLPHLEIIFETIYNECSKQHHCHNVVSYLKVFNAFLRHITSWLLACNLEIKEIQSIHIEVEVEQKESDILTSWLEVLKKSKSMSEEGDKTTKLSNNKSNQSNCNTNIQESENLIETSSLPRHIIMITSILQQVIKFMTSSELQLQILSIECLTCGIPLLHDYQNELLPLVHSTWSPLVEKFRQKNALVLNRCFSLLAILATNARDFITKRSLDDVVPFLKQFLQKAALLSAKETITATLDTLSVINKVTVLQLEAQWSQGQIFSHLNQTQEYKLQLKLLQEFPKVIECLDLDGKHLNEISEIISLYLSKEQPKELQNQAIQYYKQLHHFNAPLIYLIVVKKSNLKLYEHNIRTILSETFGVK